MRKKKGTQSNKKGEYVFDWEMYKGAPTLFYYVWLQQSN